MTIAIDIESANLETRNKKGGGTYQVQEAFAHTTDNHGNPRRYPERINIFPPKDAQGNVIAYPPGSYILAPQSIKVNNGFLELGFPQLIPMSQATKTKA
ncbi:hypothetical protein CBP51_00125 [Cellvibrio mixtus]|uniref:Single-stranded DNA-binding protein n=1 Tax=Cellvibrio mixtus TaxID=39650 RepID=A0A266Q798_9GAMM|nr:single-stranded DNA-binding protein [Cellvibrio mixtus]OZY83160.1 hypothetical protein CBP51_20450 [Cellvibrio mixtus]OZY85485.1 hypothetical protein CBP51_00070 [Cellvibrio mixtus]OZY85496.1 hypothetical protein CBP51_00125 [Cellvibrio mixtus]